MNLEQIVKETIAKFVAEKQGKDLTGDGKIDSADYLKARSNAIEKATMKNEGEDEDHEVSMAQSSLNSILRSAMELKAKIGNQEIDIPAWIQDHITNSENFIDQASQGYHEYSNGGHEGEEMNEEESERSKETTKKLDASLKNFLKNIYKNTPKDKIPEKYRAILDNLDEANLGHNETSSIEQEGRFWIVTYNTADGTKEKSFESEDEARKFYNGLDEAFQPKSSFDDYSLGDNVTVAGKKAKITAMKMDDETGERRARVKFEDGTAKEVSINSLDESQESNNDKIEKYEKYTYTLDGKVVKPEISFLNNILKAMIGNKIYNVGTPENGKVELTPESGKKGTYTESQQELDEWTVRRWQHYAGIK